jgi:putative ABC transport system permease protein
MALGAGMILLFASLGSQLQQKFKANIQGVDMVVGAKGSPLQLILASIYHIDAPTGNISAAEAFQLGKHPMVASTIPLAFGDNYRSFRIVGTTEDYFDEFDLHLEEGRMMEREMEVVLGSAVASILGLELGDHFSGQHGFDEHGHDHDDQHYEVVGIFTANGTVADQLIFSNIPTVWVVHDEEVNANTEWYEEGREITAMLVKFRSPMGQVAVPRMVNEKTNMQAALPAIEVNRLFSLMGFGLDLLRWISILVILVSGISVFISLYNSLKEKKYELALLRSMGATRGMLVVLVVTEAMILSLFGFILAYLWSQSVMMYLSVFAQRAYKYELISWKLGMGELVTAVICMALGLAAALIPSFRAFRLNISKTLRNA